MKNSLPYRIITQIICLIVLVIVMFPLCLMIEKSFAVNGFGNYVKVYLDSTFHIISKMPSE